MPRDRALATADELADFLKQHPRWRIEGGQLTRTFELGTFLDAIGFVQRVAQVAEEQDHHPDIDIRWRKVTLRLITHDAGGLTWRDVAVASACDELGPGQP